jgi:hypothetical protein
MVAVPLETQYWVTVHQEVTEATNQQQEVVAMDQQAQEAMDQQAQEAMDQQAQVAMDLEAQTLALADTVQECSLSHMNLLVATGPQLLP